VCSFLKGTFFRLFLPTPWSHAKPDVFALLAVTVARTHEESTRLVVLDPWHRTDIGHSILNVALWLHVVSASLGAPRALKFATCLPPSIYSITNVMPVCEPSHVDVHDVLTFGSFAASSTLKASRSDFGRRQRGLAKRLSVPTSCTALREALQRPRPRTLLMDGTGLRSLMPRCAAEASGSDSGGGRGCLRLVKLTRSAQLALATEVRAPPRMGVNRARDTYTLMLRPHTLPRCEVGVHLRSMAIDDRRCNLLLLEPDHTPDQGEHSGSSSGRVVDAPRASDSERACREQYGHRTRRCPHETFPAMLRGCPGTLRFATADAPELYPHTRALGWSDLNETAIMSWSGGARDRQAVAERAATTATGSSAVLAGWAATAAAFVALSRCTRAIVAPVESQFSECEGGRATRRLLLRDPARREPPTRRPSGRWQPRHDTGRGGRLRSEVA
jgi:hypothetical protein